MERFHEGVLPPSLSTPHLLPACHIAHRYGRYGYRRMAWTLYNLFPLSETDLLGGSGSTLRERREVRLSTFLTANATDTKLFAGSFKQLTCLILGYRA